MTELTAIAREEDRVFFYTTSDNAIAQVLGLDKTTSSVVLLKQEDTKIATFGNAFIYFCLNC